MSVVFIIVSHLDDVEFGMGGTAYKLCQDHDVHILSLCKGDRPGEEDVLGPRLAAFIDNCTDMNTKSYETRVYSDTKLDTISQTELCDVVYEHLQKTKADVVYTNSSVDIHRDHQIVSNCVKVAARMRHTSTVNELYEFSIPGSLEWSFNPVVFNKYVDVTDVHEQKLTMIQRYTTESKKDPDPLSVEKITARDIYYGGVCGYDKAEPFKIIYMR